MKALDRRQARDVRSPLIAAAMMARDGQFAVRVVISCASQRVLEARAAAEQAGVDLIVERTAAGITVHFVARHQDRRLAASALRPESLCSIVQSSLLLVEMAVPTWVRVDARARGEAASTPYSTFGRYGRFPAGVGCAGAESDG